MHSFFTWLSSLRTAQQTILVLMALFVLVGIPYVGRLFRILSLLLRRQFRPQILFFGLNYATSVEPLPLRPTVRQKLLAAWQRLRAFSYARFGRHAPSAPPAAPRRTALYYTENVPEFYVEGSVATLAWEVTGAYRVDVLPLRTRVSGNSLRFLFNSGQRHFVLRAFGLNGQVEATFSLPLEKFQRLHHEPLSRNVHLASGRQTPHISQPAWKERLVRQARVTKLGQSMPATRHTLRPSRLQHLTLDHTLSSHYTFSTHKYQSVLPSKKVNHERTR